LEHSNQRLREFTRVCSHDLHAPLRAVVGYAGILQEDYAGQLDETANEHLTCIADCAKRMQTLIDDLLKYARADTEEFVMDATDCTTVFDEVLANLSAAIRESEAQVTRDPLPTVRASRVHLVELLQNLVANAIKFRGDRRPEVHVAAESREDDWLFSVRDNGIGIKLKYAEVIFEPFRRLHASDEFEGSGVGLATCQKVIERHHGRIWAESQPGIGSTFYFTIPKTPTAATESAVG
jgi:light-regulated signal transduction histidine kinase (bacteriophytochrome)